MKLKKSRLIGYLFILMLVSVLRINQVYAGTNGHTQAEAVAWANSQVGKALDYDGQYGAQCVDFTCYYYQYLGQAIPWGNANQYANGGNFCPAGWSYQSSPQPGDVAVWLGGDWGHVAIVTEIRGSQMVCVEQNYNGKMYVTPNLHNIDAYTYIRPNFPSPEITPPSYTDFHVGELREGAFTVMAKVTDASGIKEVRYAVWTEKNGQDELIWYQGNHTDNNNYWWARVNFSEHNDERGNYIIHMYAYDNAGNLKTAGISYNFKSTGPTISNVQVSNITSRGYTVTCKVTDSLGVLRVQFPTWTSNNGQDDLASEWWTNTAVRGSINGNTVTFNVLSAKHNNEQGIYHTHIYAYDILGNRSFSSAPDVIVHDHKLEESSRVEPTCTSNGYRILKCKGCNEEKKEILSAKGHDWGQWTVVTPATTESEGLERRICKNNSKHVETKTIIKTGGSVSKDIQSLDGAAKKLSENADPAGSMFSILQVKAKKVKKTSIVLGWKAVPNATGYVVYGAPCGSKYGKLKDVVGTSFTQRGLKKGKYYKYFVAAHDKNGKILATSKTVHIATSGGKKGNTKSVKLNKKKKTLKVGKTFKLKATMKNGKLKVSKHRKVAYESDNPKVAIVSKSGKVKAVGKGTCYVFAYAQNGVFAKCKITVK